MTKNRSAGVALSDDRLTGGERHPLGAVLERVELRADEVGEHLRKPIVLASERRIAGRPVSRAQRPGAKGAQYPQHLVDASADVVRGDAHVHQHAVRVDDEGAAMRRPVLEQHAEGMAQLAEAVGDHRIADLGEMRIGSNQALWLKKLLVLAASTTAPSREEVVVALREGRELRRADEREVARVEEQDDPTAAVTRELEHDRRGLSADVRLQAVIGNGLADAERHS